MTNKKDEKEVASLYKDIKELVELSRNRVYKAVNTEMINLYWNIGKKIVEKQGDNSYGKKLLCCVQGCS